MMINTSLLWAIPIVLAVQGAEPTASTTSDMDAATRLERSAAAACRPEDLRPAYELIRRFGRRQEPEIRLLVARARMAVAGAFRFVSQREQARRWFTSVVRLYSNEEGDELRGLVAGARVELIEGIGDNSTRLRRLSELANELASQTGPGTSRAYYDSLRMIAEIIESRGERARAAELRQQVRNVWTMRVAPHLVPMTGDEPICV